LFSKNWFKSILIIANLIVIGGSSISPAAMQIPISGNTAPAGQKTLMGTTSNTLESFAESVADGNPHIRGVYIPYVLALNVIQQPVNQPAYVSVDPDTVTQFQMASANGSIGLLAHNYIAGAYFFDASVGDEISVVHGNGQVDDFQVKSILKFQALNPTNVSTDFIEITTQKKMSVEEIFKLVYGGKPHLTLQTCIAKGNVSSWGRLFVIAEPITQK
jgi:hypothetical protein